MHGIQLNINGVLNRTEQHNQIRPVFESMLRDAGCFGTFALVTTKPQRRCHNGPDRVRLVQAQSTGVEVRIHVGDCPQVTGYLTQPKGNSPQALFLMMQRVTEDGVYVLHNGSAHTESVPKRTDETGNGEVVMPSDSKEEAPAVRVEAARSFISSKENIELVSILVPDIVKRCDGTFTSDTLIRTIKQELRVEITPWVTLTRHLVKKGVMNKVSKFRYCAGQLQSHTDHVGDHEEMKPVTPFQVLASDKWKTRLVEWVRSGRASLEGSGGVFSSSSLKAYVLECFPDLHTNQFCRLTNFLVEEGVLEKNEDSSRMLTFKDDQRMGLEKQQVGDSPGESGLASELTQYITLRKKVSQLRQERDRVLSELEDARSLVVQLENRFDDIDRKYADTHKQSIRPDYEYLIAQLQDTVNHNPV